MFFYILKRVSLFYPYFLYHCLPHVFVERHGFGDPVELKVERRGMQGLEGSGQAADKLAGEDASMAPE